ncbi:MAG: hypothetical protein R3B90_03395 [Planctomycetaceae bacterium]
MLNRTTQLSLLVLLSVATSAVAVASEQHIEGARRAEEIMADHWTESPAAATDFTGDILRVGSWTLVLVMAAVLVVLVLRKLGIGSTITADAASGLRLQGTLVLQPRMAVHLVTNGTSEFVVAIDPRGISGVTLLPARFSDIADGAEELHESTGDEAETRAAGSRGLNVLDVSRLARSEN